MRQVVGLDDAIILLGTARFAAPTTLRSDEDQDDTGANKSDGHHHQAPKHQVATRHPAWNDTCPPRSKRPTKPRFRIPFPAVILPVTEVLDGADEV